MNKLRRKRVKSILVKSSLLLAALCTQILFIWGSSSIKIHLEEVLSIGSLEDDTLFQWVAVVSDSQNLYITDTMDYSIKLFDVKGNLLAKTGRKGKGPGEFLAPRFLGVSERLLYATDQYIPGIQVFDKELHYRKRIPIFIPIADMKILSDDEIAVASLSMDDEKKGRIFIFNQKGEIVRSIKYMDRKTAFMLEMVSFDFDRQSNLYLAYNFQDKIQKYNAQGKRLWSKRLLRVKKPEMQEIRSLKLPSKLIYKDITLDGSGNLFVLGGSYSENPSRDVYVLSPEGRILTTITLPDTSHCIYIDCENNLYSRANEGVTLKKYNMRYTDEVP